ncbi:MAG: FISUMP domain-containing protein [Bacteroidales bacterium]
MKTVQIRYFFILALVMAGLTHCLKEEITKTPPVAAFKLAPASGLTTTIFQFDAIESKATNANDTILFIRWDWDNDSIWDTGFSRSRKFTHRYYKPGSYIPRMEIRNEAGLSDTIQWPVQVARGYSAPQPGFTISPSSGNLRTEFVFDAGKTRDDEDSLNTLKLRWDWDGDGNFDTEFSEQTVVSHFYNAASIYNVALEVVDPQGLTATIRKSVSVSLSNLKLVPQFTWTPEKPTTSDTVQFDASSSYDPDHAGNTFTYRWNFTKDSDFDTEYLSNPVFGYQFPIEGENEVILEIKDQWGLINQTKVKIWIAHSNLKPTAAFFIGYEYGNRTTNFYFDAEATQDGEDLIDQLKVRWDFESDGIWDTEFVKEKTANHKYSTSGKFRVKTQVIDTGGLTDTTSLSVNVTDGTNETGLILDKKNNISYGTVKIGTQWWMSENLNEASKGKFCYSNQAANCTTYGGLYTWTDAMNTSTTEKARGLCPQGWHIPSLNEWQQLLDFYGADLAKKQLEVTGDSDFRMFLAGQRSTAGRSEMLNLVTNFWTSTKSSGENAQAISFQKDQDNYFKLNLAQNYGFSVRCIKD